MVRDLAEVLRDLKALGTADQIAERIRTAGILGRPKTTGQCPLARLLHESCGGEYVVGREKIIRRSGVGRSVVEEVKTPKNAREFVERFDHQDYPNLIDPKPVKTDRSRPRPKHTGKRPNIYAKRVVR